MVINKVLLFALAGLFIINFSSAQNNSSQTKNYTEYPHWIEMMQDKSVNFYETQNAFNEYWKDRKITKGSGWKPFKRWEWWTERHINPDGSYQPADNTYQEYKKYLAKYSNAKDFNGDWENLGPMNVPSKGYEGLGRVNAIAFHPTDPDIVYIGAPAGGCWKYDAGTQEWFSTTDELPTLGVSSIVVDWNDPDNVLIGTGDRDAGDAAGMGIFKSSDGGITWESAVRIIENIVGIRSSKTNKNMRLRMHCYSILFFIKLGSILSKQKLMSASIHIHQVHKPTFLQILE